MKRRISLLVAFLLGMVPMHPAQASEAPRNGRDLVLAGVYSDQWQSAADINALGQASGKKVSLVGTFHHLWESENGVDSNTDWLLEQAWSAQATPVANVEVAISAYDMAAGGYDSAIRQWALRVKGWLDRGGGRSLLIAPLQEMNGDWVAYGQDPGNYQITFRRFVEIFRSEGIDETKVRWVFAPNAWSVGHHSMADYYPGDDIVDFVGISVYNFGASVGRWTSVFESGMAAVETVRSFAPTKPYLITQIGSSTSGGDRDAWLREMFAFAATDPNVVGLIYFNFNKETDWKVWDGSTPAQGWMDGMQAPGVEYRWPLCDLVPTGSGSVLAVSRKVHRRRHQRQPIRDRVARPKWRGQGLCFRPVLSQPLGDSGRVGVVTRSRSRSSPLGYRFLHR